MAVIYPGGEGPIIIRGCGEVVQSTNEHVPVGAEATVMAPRTTPAVPRSAATPEEHAPPGGALEIEAAPPPASTQACAPPVEAADPAVLHVPDPEEKKTAPEQINNSPDTVSVHLIY